jgi:hypothetical protein
MNYIDKIYYINLDKRIDRKKIMEEQFNKFNIINYERVSAICPFFNKKYDNDFIDSQIEIFLNNKLLVNDLIDG